MNKIFSAALLLIAGAAAFTSCDDDRDSNPTLKQAENVVLNEPVFKNQLTDLEKSDSLTFTWSQPSFTVENAPVVVYYTLQVSTTGNFTYSYAEQEATADSETPVTADYFEYDASYTKLKGNVLAANLNKQLVQLMKYEEGNVPAKETLYVRLKAAVRNTHNPTLPEYTSQVSNVVSFDVVPYYVELKDAAPQIWYLIGGCIGDGGWTNDKGSIGKSLIPMFTKDGEEYDKKTGTGIIEYTGFFPEGGEFKILKEIGNWDYGFCGDGTPMGVKLRNGGDDPGNIKVGEAGYYTITIDTKEVTCKIEKAGITPNVYPMLCVAGDQNGWSDTDMTAVETYEGAENHIWIYKGITAGGMKIKIAGSWDTNWGSDMFPYGTGTQGGPNIPVADGTYTLIFNDITGQFMFTAE